MKLKFEEQATPSNNIQIGDMFAYRGGTGLVYMRCRDDKWYPHSPSKCGYPQHNRCGGSHAMQVL